MAKKNYCDINGKCNTFNKGISDTECKYYKKITLTDSKICFFCLWGECINKEARAEVGAKIE